MSVGGGSLTVHVLDGATMSDNSPLAGRTLPDDAWSTFGGVSWVAAIGRDGSLITARGIEDRDDDLDGCGSRRGGGTKGGMVDDCSEAVRSVRWARGLCAFLSRGDRFLVSGSRETAPPASPNACAAGASWRA
jgi:hypothetical protein